MKLVLATVCLLGCGAFQAAAARAQDTVVDDPSHANKGGIYELPKIGKKGKEEVPVDPKLADRLADKIRVCYKAEAHKEMSEQDSKLLDEYKVSLVRELSSGFRLTGCKDNEPSNAKCLANLDIMECAELAKAIKAKRWDKHLLQEDRDILSAYTGGLIGKRAECRAAQGDESDPAETQVEADRLGLVITMQITIGKCQIDPKGQAACKQTLAKLSCPEIERASQHNKLTELCPMLLRCTSTGPTVE
jgi:hypothetical protein